MAQSYVAPGEKLGAVSTFGIGGLAGVITVYTTMPLDTVKTRYVPQSFRPSFSKDSCIPR
jgi:hypothetical protein